MVEVCILGKAGVEEVCIFPSHTLLLFPFSLPLSLRLCKDMDDSPVLLLCIFVSFLHLLINPNLNIFLQPIVYSISLLEFAFLVKENPYTQVLFDYFLQSKLLQLKKRGVKCKTMT